MRFLFSLKTTLQPTFFLSAVRSSTTSHPRLVRFNSLRSYSDSFDSALRYPASMAIPPPIKSVAALDSEVGLAKRFWIKFRAESVLALYSPFVLSLAAGNLRIETFRHYIAQDVHFLRAFAQAYGLAEQCADDDDAKLSISELRKAVLDELKMHGSFVQVAGSLSEDFPSRFFQETPRKGGANRQQWACFWVYDTGDGTLGVLNITEFLLGFSQCEGTLVVVVKQGVAKLLPYICRVLF